MGSVNIYSKPSGVIAAYQDGKGLVNVSFSSDCVSLLVEISSDKQYQKEFTGEDLSGGSVQFNIQKYIQSFSFNNNEVYSSSFELINGYIKNSYSVSVLATFSDNTTDSASFNGMSLCSIKFDSEGPAPETFYLTDHFGNPITDHFGNNITVSV
jgi:hypothetical protein